MIKLLFKIIVCGSIVSFVSCNESGSIERSDLESKELLGKVQQVTTVNYDVYDKFGEGNLQRTMPEYIFLVNICSFDSLGNLHTDKTLEVRDIKRIYKSIYDNNHRNIKSIFYEDNDDSKIDNEYVYYYNDKGLVTKEVNIKDNETKNYSYTFNKEGKITSQIGGLYDKKLYWEYDNGQLVKKTEYMFSMKWEWFYKNGLLYKDVRSPSIYWTYTYDDYGRPLESTMYKNGNIDKKIKEYYSGIEGMKPIKMTEWNTDGTIEHDYNYSYFISGKDTLAIFTYDKNELKEVVLNAKDSSGLTEDTYNTTSYLLSGYQYIYENEILRSRLSLNTGLKQNYIDDILTIIKEEDDEVTEKKYKRHNLISDITKDKRGKTISSMIVEFDGNKELTTVVNNEKTKKGEAIYENGKLVKYTNAYLGTTTTYSYNKEGFVSEAKDNDGTIITYKYEYDDKGNWVRKITYKNNEPQSITERSIVYYE